MLNSSSGLVLKGTPVIGSPLSWQRHPLGKEMNRDVSTRRCIIGSTPTLSKSWLHSAVWKAEVILFCPKTDGEPGFLLCGSSAVTKHRCKGDHYQEKSSSEHGYGLWAGTQQPLLRLGDDLGGFSDCVHKRRCAHISHWVFG